MATSTAENDAEDVNDFLKRIQELGNKRDQEDEERNRKLEEEILQGRKERQARRAERARSISPAKESPLNTPQSYKSHGADSPAISLRGTFAPSRDLQPFAQTTTTTLELGDTMERLTGQNSPTKENAESSTDPQRGHTVEANLKRADSARMSPSSAMPSRSSTLSWQRRPDSQASDRPRSRPLSMIATENATRSPKLTPETSPKTDVQPLSRNQIAQSLASKDPTWFRQSSDRIGITAAYRKNQVEDEDVETPSLAAQRMQLPGMDRAVLGKDSAIQDGASSRTVSSSASAQEAVTSRTNSPRPASSCGIGSPMPVNSAQRLPPPQSSGSASPDVEYGRSPAMSPSQGRISPERMERPASPTKGMGGFVQSAMMKRSDSVNKRWSVQSSTGLSRGNSIAGKRSSHDLSAAPALGVLANSSGIRQSGLSRESSPRPQSRPGSSHSTVTATPDAERPGTSSSMRSSITVSTTHDGFVKPGLPASRSQGSMHSGKGESDAEGNAETLSRTRPVTPSSASKLNDTRRWSPTKSSWLESALNKPDSPKPKPTPPPQQPSWMSEINRAKTRGSVDLANREPAAPKHEVSIGGLLRSPAMGGPAKPLSVGGLPAGFSSGAIRKETGTGNSSHAPTSDRSAPSLPSKNEAIAKAAADPVASVLASMKAVSTDAKPKPATPPKKDFRSSLKPRQAPTTSDGKNEPEFKNVFGQLRRTKTQNYVAPDELKDNILRGKAGLSQTAGPQKSGRKDEFKEAILKKKDDFKKAQQEGSGVVRERTKSVASSELPEALAKKASLGKSGTATASERAQNEDSTPLSVTDLPRRPSNNTTKPSLPQESSAPGRMEGRDAIGGKLAARFNPALAGLLARGPLPAVESGQGASSPISQVRSGTPSNSTPAPQESGPALVHMTKARARGPRRKAPTAAVSTTKASAPETAEATTKPTLSVSTEAPQRAALQPRSTTLPSAPVMKTFLKDETVESPATSPRKLDMKRRSRFLEEVPNKNETVQQGASTKTPTKAKEVSTEVPQKAEHGGVPEAIIKSIAKPTPLAKSPSLASLNGREASKAPSTPLKSPSLKNKPIPSPKSPILTQYRVLGTEALPLTPSKPDSAISARLLSPKSTVGMASAMFSRAAAPPSSQPAKAPITLPTQADENAAMEAAGLRGSEPNVAIPVTLQSVQDSPRAPSFSTRTTATCQPPISAAKPITISPVSLPSSPAKKAPPPSPQRTETTKILSEFFGRVDEVSDLPIDTGSILAARPEQAKIKSLGAQLYQLLSRGKKQPVPPHQERILFESDMYLCRHEFSDSNGKNTKELYFWVGDDVSESASQEAAIFAQTEAKTADSKLVNLRQGKESAEFIEALGGILILRRQSSNKYDSLAPHILCGRRHVGQIVFDEVDFAPTSLCSGFPYLISTASGKVYLWKGKGSGVDELSCARLIGMDLGMTGDIIEVEESNEPADFLAAFSADARIYKSADHWRMKPSFAKYSTRLFLADTSARSPEC